MPQASAEVFRQSQGDEKLHHATSAGVSTGPAGVRIGEGSTVSGGAVLGEGVTVGAGNVLTRGVRVFPQTDLPDGAITF